MDNLNITETNFGVTFSNHRTYSDETYTTYGEKNDKNIFEEAVDNAILDKYASVEEKEYILSNPKEDQRLMTLSLLDTDNELWCKLYENIHGNSTPKMEQIRETLLMLREFVKTGNMEKKNFGEVMTPIDEVVIPMLKTLSNRVWVNPYLKWLDPANGCGPYPMMVIYKLMKTLRGYKDDKLDLTDDDVRYKHIVENMIYTSDIQAKNVFLWQIASDPSDEFNLNSYWGSSLGEEFDFHMKKVWNIDKFDIILGNSPYQEVGISGKSKGGGKGGDNNLWSKFIYKFLPLCDNLLFINPSSFLSPNHNILNFFNDNGIISNIKIYNKSPFDNASTTACHYLWERNSKFDYSMSSEGFKIDLKTSILPNSSNVIDFTLFGKFFNNKKEKINFIRTCTLHTSTKKQYISKEESDTFIHPLASGSKTLFSSIKSKDHDDKKVIVSRSGYLNPKYDDGKTSISESNYYVIVEGIEEGNKIETLLKSKLYDYVLKKTKFSGFFHGEVLKNIPLVPFDREWTDEKLYEYFDLTEDEIKLIEG